MDCFNYQILTSPQPRPCFNLELLHSLNEWGEFINRTQGKFLYDNAEYPIKYSILVSEIPNVFNLGGDLELFIRLIQEQNKLGLLQYGQKCIEVLYCNYRAYGLHLTTVSLVQGLCLGGGFEAALSSDILIAERGSRFGFPEITFNLFPGMGAYTFLSRRLGQRLADEFISSGRRYTADELFDWGLVHAVVENGEGNKAVRELIAKRERSQNGL